MTSWDLLAGAGAAPRSSSSSLHGLLFELKAEVRKRAVEEDQRGCGEDSGGAGAGARSGGGRASLSSDLLRLLRSSSSPPSSWRTGGAADQDRRGGKRRRPGDSDHEDSATATTELSKKESAAEAAAEQKDGETGGGGAGRGGEKKDSDGSAPTEDSGEKGLPSRDRYTRMREECLRDESRRLAFHRRQMQKIRDVRDVYLFGLQKVSALQDLRDAPDAILPGNFPGGGLGGGSTG
jgi:hypothetical protein